MMETDDEIKEARKWMYRYSCTGCLVVTFLVCGTAVLITWLVTR